MLTFVDKRNIDQKAIESFRKRDWEAVVQLWKKALAKSKKSLHATSIQQLATAYFRIGRLDKAEQFLKQILEKSPNNPDALAELATASSLRGKWDDAGRRWTAAILAHENFKRGIQTRRVYAAAEALRKNNYPIKAAEILARYAPEEKNNDTFLAKANLSIDNPDRWLSCLNGYFAKSGLSRVGLRMRKESDNDYYSALSSPGSINIERNTKISVIMTTLNSGKYIDASIRSVLNQTWKNIELLVVDDQSQDDTVDVVHKFMARESNIRLFVNTKKVRLGVAISRNIGLMLSTGDFVTCHESDDWAHPDRLRLQAEHLLNNPNLFGNMTKSVRMKTTGEFENLWWAGYTSRRCVPTLMFPKDKVLKQVGYWDSVHDWNDVEFIDRIKAAVGPDCIQVLPQPAYFMLRRTGSITTRIMENQNVVFDPPEFRLYRAAYTKWHQTTNRTKIYIPFPVEHRPFYAPKELVIPFAVVKNVLSKASLI